MGIWPWSKIDALEQKVLELECEVSEMEDALDIQASMIKNTELRLTSMRSLVRRAHFRDPKTGRIGRKGQLFND
jgi:hypothetical protein